MADHIDLPERRDCEHTDEWIARFTDEQLVAYRAHLVAERATFVDETPPTSTYRSASYRSYRYGRWIQMVDAERVSRDPAVQAARAAKMEAMERDHNRFARWVAQDLTSNRMRGLWAEWLLTDRLGLLHEGSGRIEWDHADIRLGSTTIEVKTAGTRQQWSEQLSTPRFSIAPQTSTWDATTNTSTRLEPPRRTAALYVFCLHSCDELTNSAVTDENNWEFWVVPTALLDERFPKQKTLGLAGVRQFGPPSSTASRASTPPRPRSNPRPVGRNR